MAREIINVGAAPNDGTGDPIRTAYIKCNDNFGELYSRAQVNPPATLIGTVGDEAGMYAYDSTDFYYCFQDYDGSSVIWAQVPSAGNVTVTNITNGSSDIDIPTANGNVLVSVANVANVVVFTSTGAIVNGDFTVTGNATLSGNILGDRIQNGTTSIDIPGSGSNANITVAGTSNIAVFANTGLFVTGEQSTTGNVSGGNLLTAGLVSAAGNLTGANVNAAGLSLTGNVLSDLNVTSNVAANNFSLPTNGKFVGDFSGTLANGRSLLQTSNTTTFSPTFISVVPHSNNTFDPPAAVTTWQTANTTFNTGFSLQTHLAEARLATIVIGAGTYLPITIYSSNAEAMRVDLSGNIGIANTAPADKLAVTGNAYVSGNVTGDILLAGSFTKTTPVAFASLPSAATAGSGARAFITDSGTTTFAANASGGGSNAMPVFSDGSVWKLG